MDEFVKAKLAEWDLGQLEQTFQNNEIDELSFNALTDEDIKELIPVLGPRKKFILKYNVYVKLEQGTKSISSSPEEDELTTIPQYNKPTCFLGLHDIERSLGNNFPDFNLRNLLETSPNGKAILNYYTEHKIIDDSSRTILVDTIVRHIYLYIVQHRLKQEQYGVITNKIIQLFPEEVGATYYSPYVPKRSNGGGKCVLAKGRLVDKVRNILFRSGDTVSHRKRKINETDVEPQNTPPLDSETQSSITFLKFFDEPWDEVVSHWKNTVDYRRNSKVLGVSDFMSEWPILRNNKSTSLINLDFEYCYKNSSLLLLNNWNKFWDTIIATKGKHIPTNIVSFINIIEDTNTSTDIKILCQLKVLCHIIPPKGRMRTKKEDWKFSINECEESIVLTVPCAGDVEKEITGQREKAYLRKYPLQPFICVIGNLQEIKSIFVVIDQIRYQCETLLHAVDLLFKIFHVFNATYPPASEHLWFLIQKGIFKITTTYDKNFPYVLHFLKALEKHMV